MRAPIWLYRAGLGFVFGSRVLMLEHIGRKSGARRYVVLEVVGHPAPEIYIVASGFGEHAQWFRNLMAHPRVRVSAAGAGRASRRLAGSQRPRRWPVTRAGIRAHGRSSRTFWRTRSARRSVNATPRCPWSSCAWTGLVHETRADRVAMTAAGQTGRARPAGAAWRGTCSPYCQTNSSPVGNGTTPASTTAPSPGASRTRNPSSTQTVRLGSARSGTAGATAEPLPGVPARPGVAPQHRAEPDGRKATTEPAGSTESPVGTERARVLRFSQGHPGA